MQEDIKRYKKSVVDQTSQARYLHALTRLYKRQSAIAVAELETANILSAGNNEQIEYLIKNPKVALFCQDRIIAWNVGFITS